MEGKQKSCLSSLLCSIQPFLEPCTLSFFGRDDFFWIERETNDSIPLCRYIEEMGNKGCLGFRFEEDVGDIRKP